MALAIKLTPKLGRRASRKFLKKVQNDLRKPVGLVPTPKLNEAKKLIIHKQAEHEEFAKWWKEKGYKYATQTEDEADWINVVRCWAWQAWLARSAIGGEKDETW